MSRWNMAIALASPLSLAALPGIANADTYYKFTVDSANSVTTLDADVAAPLSGTFKGNHDAVNNPTGTMTRPGLFGGSGNMPITYSGTITGGTTDEPAQTNPAGSYRAAVSNAIDSITISQLNIDALNSATPSFPATFNILYQTFRTFQPDSLFPGGVTLPIPLGNLIVQSATITQTATADPAALTSIGKNQYTFIANVPVTIDYLASFTGTPIAGSTPAMLILTGTLTIIDSNSASIASSFEWSTTQTDKGPFDPLVDVPLDVPTVLPTGGTAHLLVSGQLQSITATLTLQADVSSHGLRIKPGDVNGDLAVNVADLLSIISAWGPCANPPCAADVAPFPDGDGTINVTDLLLVISNWGS